MPRVLFDSSHNEYLRIGKWGSCYFDADPERLDWQEFALAVAKCGFEVAQLDSGRLGNDLSQLCDILVLGCPESHFHHSWPKKDRTAKEDEKWGFLTDDEIRAVLEFVRKGGGLLVIQEKHGEQRRGNNLNKLVADFGVAFNDDRVESLKCYANRSHWLVIEDFRDHPVTEGINTLIYFEGCSLVTEGTAQALGFANKQSSPSSAPLIAASSFGSGKVICLGDATLFTQWGLGQSFPYRDQHFRLVWNSFRWLTPSHCVSDKKAGMIAQTADILSPIVAQRVQEILLAVHKLGKNVETLQQDMSVSRQSAENTSAQAKNAESALASMAKETRSLNQRVEAMKSDLDALQSGLAAEDVRGYWTRAADVIGDLLLVFAAFFIGLCLQTKIPVDSGGLVLLVVVLAATAALAVKVFAIPVLRTRKQ